MSAVADLPAVLRGDNEYLRRAMEEGYLDLGWGPEGTERHWPAGVDDWLDLPQPEKGLKMEESTRRYGRRRELVREYSWAIPNDAALDAIAELSPIVEIGAGNGYWAMLLRQRGAEVAAFDLHPPGPDNDYAKRRWSETSHQETPAALHAYPTLFLCWPSEDEVWPEKALAEFSGPTVAYVGTDEGGCCATPGFFALLERDFEHVREVAIPRWYGIRDSLTIWRRAEAA